LVRKTEVDTLGEDGEFARRGNARSGGRGFMRSTAIGVIGLIVLLAVVVASEGEVGYYWNPLGIAIVFGGTAVTAFIGFRLSEIAASLAAFVAIFREEPSIAPDIKELLAVARLHAGSHVREAEEHAHRVKSPFLRIGLQLVLDGTPLDDVLQVMNWRLQKMIERESAQTRFYRTLAGLAPGFGLVGTLAGMVGMLKQLGTGNIALIGSSMAVAMLATLYGVVLSNLILKPIATKLEQRTLRRAAMLNILLEGVVLFRLGRTPGVIGEALTNLMADAEDELRDR